MDAGGSVVPGPRDGEVGAAPAGGEHTVRDSSRGDKREGEWDSSGSLARIYVALERNTHELSLLRRQVEHLRQESRRGSSESDDGRVTALQRELESASAARRVHMTHAGQLRRSMEVIAQQVQLIERSERWRIGGVLVGLFNAVLRRRARPDAVSKIRGEIAKALGSVPSGAPQGRPGAGASQPVSGDIRMVFREELWRAERRLEQVYADTLVSLLGIPDEGRQKERG